MRQSINFHVIFSTLMCGIFLPSHLHQAYAGSEDTIREVLKSNSTRNDFSGLLHSLIKLNEQRFGLLQKLNKLEDYGVVNEVLRTNNRKPKAGDDMYLVVLSKNQKNPGRRNFQKDDQKMVSVPVIKIRRNGTFVNIKQENILEQVSEKISSAFTDDTRSNMEMIVDVNEKVDRAPNRYDLIREPLTHESHKIEPYKTMQIEIVDTKHLEPLQGKTEEKEDNKLLQLTNDYHNPMRDNMLSNKLKGRFNIVTNEEKITNLSHEIDRLYADSNNDTPVVTDNIQNIQYNELNSNIVNDHNTKMNTSVEKENPKISIENNNNVGVNDLTVYSPLSAERSFTNYNKLQYPNVNEEIQEKKDRTPKRNTGKTNEYSKLNEDKSNEGYNDFEITVHKDSFDNSKENGRDDKYPKINMKEFKDDVMITPSEPFKDYTNHNVKYSQINIGASKKKDYLNVNNLLRVNKDNTNGNNNNNKYRKPNINTPKDHDDHVDHLLNKSKDSDKKDTITKVLKNIINNYQNTRPQKVEDPYNEGGLEVKESNENKPFDKNPEKVKDYGGEDYNNYNKISIEKHNSGETRMFNEGRNIHRQNEHPSLNQNAFNQDKKNTRKPVIRKHFQSCINKKALKLCIKSCNNAYKTVCKQLRCTSKSKRALKRECKRSCKKTFGSSKSKSCDSYEDGSDEDY